MDRKYTVNVNDAFNGGTMDTSREFDTEDAALAYAHMMANEGYGEGIEFWQGDTFVPRYVWSVK